MPSRLVSNCDALHPVIAAIINKPLQTGHFPEDWKEALVHPLLKKRGLDAVSKNLKTLENGQSDAITAMESCVRVIRKWLHENRLLINETKTEFLLIGTKQQLGKVNVDHVKVGNADIVPQKTEKQFHQALSCLHLKNK